MAASSYIHVDHVGTRVTGIRLTEKGKDRSTLDDLYSEIGDALTLMIGEINEIDS